MSKYNLKHARTCVYNVNYHIVWSTKYRRKVLTEEIAEYLQDLFQEIAVDKDFEVILAEIGEMDHVHVFASAHPKISPSYIVKMLKGISGRQLFLKYPEIRGKLWEGHLWNSSFYLETVVLFLKKRLKSTSKTKVQRGDPMKLAKRCTIVPSTEQRVTFGCICYAARKLWNVANYERKQWSKDSGLPYPNWYDQKKRLKSHFWYKNLPSQSAQELLKVLDGSWKSYYKLTKTNGIKNPRPPRYKQNNFNVRFLNNGFQITDNKVRFSLPTSLKDYLKTTYGIKNKYLFVDVPKHLQLVADKVKIIEIRPLNNGKYELIFVIEAAEPPMQLPDKRFMAIDIGVTNFLTCYLHDGSSYIFSGRQLLSINRYYDKTIAHYASIAWAQQVAQGKKYLQNTKRINQLYEKRIKQVNQLLHCMTRSVVDMAHSKGVTTIVIGDITGIREDVNFGHKTNQKFHRLPYRKIINQIKYKAKLLGISVIDTITEEYTSQTCCSCKDMPSKTNARKSNRKYRGLYICKDCGSIINADVNGAINISKKYLETLHERPVVVLSTPKVYRFKGSSFVA